MAGIGTARAGIGTPRAWGPKVLGCLRNSLFLFELLSSEERRLNQPVLPIQVQQEPVT